MTRWLRSSCGACIGAVGLLTTVPTALAQSRSLGTARSLYVAAAYEDALAMLNGLPASDRREDKGLVEQYRAFCLLALGRMAEADRAIEAAIVAAPFTQPSENDVSPRVRSRFRDVRRRMLPAIIERQYAEAKAAFHRRDTAAAERFTQLLKLIADAELQSVVTQPPLSQLRAMATDFLALSTPRASPPPLQPHGAQPPGARPPTAPAAPRDPARIYGSEDADVVPPAAAIQSLTAMGDVFSSPRPGTIEIVINETGAVIAATTKVSVDPLYDRVALQFAKTWRYRPAMREGVAVKYRMLVQFLPPPKR
jgi:TonB family protein